MSSPNQCPSVRDLDAWTAKLEEKDRQVRNVAARYLAHMSKVADCLYLAGEAVKKGENGYADSQHRLARLHLDAAEAVVAKAVTEGK